MKKSNLREQFKKETGLDLKDSLYLYGAHDDECFSDEYVEWLETINSEMINALVETRSQLTIAMSHEEPIPTKVLVDWCTQVEQALKKAGCGE